MRENEINEIEKLKKTILELKQLTGKEAINVSQLPKNATFFEWKEAFAKDRKWFKAFADRIHELL